MRYLLRQLPKLVENNQKRFVSCIGMKVIWVLLYKKERKIKKHLADFSNHQNLLSKSIFNSITFSNNLEKLRKLQEKIQLAQKKQSS